MKNINFKTTMGHLINATIHKCEGTAVDTILYFHGGGLLYGTRNDLPLVYIKSLLESGHNIICYDYPLAPENSLTEIHEAVYECALHFLQFHADYDINSNDYYLFGRSAGTYLITQLANKIRISNQKQPNGLICFYGYVSFDNIAFYQKSDYYLQFSEIPKESIENICFDKYNIDGDVAKRFSMYIYGRQNGCWHNMISKSGEELKQFSLNSEELSLLPPAFITASSTDRDVPFKMSKDMSKQIPNSVFKPVYNLEHDFDRNYTLKEATDIYRDLILWLEKINTIG